MCSRPPMCCLLSAAKEMVKVLPRCRKICRDRERPCRSCRAVGCSTPLQPARNGAPGFILMSPDKNCKNLPERISARKNPAGPLWKTGRVAQDLPTWGQKCAALEPLRNRGDDRYGSCRRCGATGKERVIPDFGCLSPHGILGTATTWN